MKEITSRQYRRERTNWVVIELSTAHAIPGDNKTKSAALYRFTRNYVNIAGRSTSEVDILRHETKLFHPVTSWGT
jgi:hypothetical protein